MPFSKQGKSLDEGGDGYEVVKAGTVEVRQYKYLK